MNKIIQRRSSLLAFILLLLLSTVCFRELFLNGKLPIAFDYGVYTYQPWKLEYEETFTQAPKAIGHDDIRIFYPQRKFTTETLKKGEIPFWNPYEFSGNVSMANSQTATFYPPFLLFLCLPQTVAWAILSLSIPLIAGFGFFLFLRQIVKNKSAAILGSLIFAFSSSVITRTEDGLVAGQTLIWLPWALYGIELWFTGNKWKGIIATIFSLSFSMLAGWFQFTFYTYGLGFFYVLFDFRLRKDKQRTLRDLTVILGAFVSCLFLTAFHWLPAVEALRYSPRGTVGVPLDFVTKHLMPFTHLITLLIPDFFGHIANNTYFGASEYKEGVVSIGTLPFLLAVTALLKRPLDPRKKFFASVTIGALLLGIKTPISKLIISLNLPLVSTFLPNRILFLAAFALAVLAAYGFKEALSKRKNSFYSISKLTVGFFLILYFAIGVLYVYEKVFAQITGISFFEKGIERYIRIIAGESIIPAVFTGTVFLILGKSKGNTTKVLLAVLVGLTLFGQIQTANRYLYFSEAEHEFPQNPVFTFLKEKTANDYSRFLSLAYSRIPSNVPLYYNLYFPEGVDAMYPKWYGEFAGFYNSASSDYFSRIEASFSEEFERRGWLDPKNINLLSHLGIRYIIVPKDHHLLPPEGAFRKVFSQGWHTIYEYKYAFPKAYFVPRFSVVEKKTLGLIRIFHPEFFDEPEVMLSVDRGLSVVSGQSQGKLINSNLDLREKYLLKRTYEEPDPFANVKHALEELKQNPVSVVLYTPNRIELSCDLKQDGLIVINDTYFPGWEAKVDGEPNPVLRANYAFRAIPVKKGQHKLSLSYFPKTFRSGLLIAITSGLCIIIMTSIVFITRLKKGQ